MRYWGQLNPWKAANELRLLLWKVTGAYNGIKSIIQSEFHKENVAGFFIHFVFFWSVTIDYLLSTRKSRMSDNHIFSYCSLSLKYIMRSQSSDKPAAWIKIEIFHLDELTRRPVEINLHKRIKHRSSLS